MRPDDEVRLRHMIEAAETAQAFTRGRGRVDLQTDQLFAFALTRAIEVLGEAASRVTLETRQTHSAIPWAPIVAMRNRLIHAYFDVDLDILWVTAAAELPALLPLLRAALAPGSEGPPVPGETR
jgi:uncharacterized protein with HEPN domain